MKPRIGDKIYVPFSGSISLYTVEMLGKETFATDACFKSWLLESARVPLYYEDYGTTWHTDLNSAKTFVEENVCIENYDKPIWINPCSDYWELVDEL